MVIDFHTHAFPDKIALRAITSLAEKGNISAFGTGTISDLISKMDEDGVDFAVVNNIATKPEQETNVNNFAISLLDNPRIIPFASVYPGSDTALSELERVKEAGIKGIKMHPEYQSFYIDDEKVMPVYDKCAELGLIVTLHCGGDVGFKPPYHATPERIEKITRLFPDTVFVCAHMGGYDMWAEFERAVTGKDNLYIDTSMTGTVARLNPDTARKIIDKIGINHVLFGSDMPWAREGASINTVKSWGLSVDALEKIFWGNAKRLLGI